jgi:hypothetical protein
MEDINISDWRGQKVEQLTDTSAVVGHVVPTSVAKRDDRFYVGNLGTFPIVVGSSKLYQVNHEGSIIDYWPVSPPSSIFEWTVKAACTYLNSPARPAILRRVRGESCASPARW